MTPPNDPVVDPEQDVMTAEEAAAFLRIEVKALYASCSANRVPHRRVSARLIRFSRSRLKAWLEQGEQAE